MIGKWLKCIQLQSERGMYAVAVLLKTWIHCTFFFLSIPPVYHIPYSQKGTIWRCSKYSTFNVPLWSGFYLRETWPKRLYWAVTPFDQNVVSVVSATRSGMHNYLKTSRWCLQKQPAHSRRLFLCTHFQAHFSWHLIPKPPPLSLLTWSC